MEINSVRDRGACRGTGYEEGGEATIEPLESEINDEQVSLPAYEILTYPADYTLSVGCGSFEVSWLRCEDIGVAVFRVVDAFVLAAEVEAPVVVEVAGGDEGAEFQDGLGAFEAPSRARDVHSVLDDVPAGAFDDPGGDGPAFGQRGGVVQVVLLVLQVAGALVGAGALGGRVAVGGGAAADPGRDLRGLSAQDLAGLVSDPFLGGGLALVEEGPGGLPAGIRARG